MSDVHVVVPESIDDPTRPSGGNSYDRRICAGLDRLGWDVAIHRVSSTDDPPAEAAMAGALSAVPDGGLVLVDGLVGCAAPRALLTHAARLELVVLVHMPFGASPDAHRFAAAEPAVLSAAAVVVTTSSWTRDELLSRYLLPPHRVHVVRPGVDSAAAVTGTPAGGELICVGAFARHKGQDVLVAALAGLASLEWHCVCIGSLDHDRPYVARVRAHAEAAGITERISLPGPMTGGALDRAYAAADVLVMPSRFESYGMVVLEALARGIPVVATSAGGIPEALGQTTDGGRPGILLPPDDPASLRAAITDWLSDETMRDSLREAALGRSATLGRWEVSAHALAGILLGVGAHAG